MGPTRAVRPPVERSASLPPTVRATDGGDARGAIVAPAAVRPAPSPPVPVPSPLPPDPRPSRPPLSPGSRSQPSGSSARERSLPPTSRGGWVPGRAALDAADVVPDSAGRVDAGRVDAGRAGAGRDAAVVPGTGRVPTPGRPDPGATRAVAAMPPVARDVPRPDPRRADGPGRGDPAGGTPGRAVPGRDAAGRDAAGRDAVGREPSRPGTSDRGAPGPAGPGEDSRGLAERRQASIDRGTGTDLIPREGGRRGRRGPNPDRGAANVATDAMYDTVDQAALRRVDVHERTADSTVYRKVNRSGATPDRAGSDRAGVDPAATELVAAPAARRVAGRGRRDRPTQLTERMAVRVGEAGAAGAVG
ncbi:hypothetical protein ND747_27815, partial [Frankia sp. R82]|nr:hypothetical protein [Frankia sp. R82]